MRVIQFNITLLSYFANLLPTPFDIFKIDRYPDRDKRFPVDFLRLLGPLYNAILLEPFKTLLGTEIVL